VQIVVGLGNPGPAYADTRHNLGFQVLDTVARRYGLQYSLVSGLYEWARWRRPAATCVLLKPLTYMNLSGRALVAWARRNAVALPGPAAGGGLTPVVVCDDLALPLGALRIRPSGSDGGQKGLASVIQALGSQEFARIRLGIAPRRGPVAAPEWSDYVLQPFTQDEIPLARELVDRAAAALICLLDVGPEAAAARFNRRESPKLD